MGFCIIGNLVTDARRQDKLAAISKLRLQFTLQTKQDVTLLAPVIGNIVRRILNHPDSDRAKLPCPPDGGPGLAVMSSWLDLRPIGEPEGNFSYAHSLNSVVSSIESVTRAVVPAPYPSRVRSNALLEGAGSDRSTNQRAKKPADVGSQRDRLRAKHYGYLTEKFYLQWIRRFILFRGKRHPRDLGKVEIESGRRREQVGAGDVAPD